MAFLAGQRSDAITRWAAAILAAIGAAAIWLALAPAAQAQRWGPPATADIPQTRLFDLGVTDYDGDGLLDLFTTNHKARGVLLRNEGGSSFADTLGAVGLSPTPAFPGLEYLRRPVMDAQAVYVYATDSTKEQLPGVIHLRSIGKEASGRIVFETNTISIRRARRAQIKLSRSPAGRPVVDFRLLPGAALDIRANHLDLPIYFAFQTSAPLPPPLPSGLQPRDIRVGTLAKPANDRRFVLTLRDRHGFAFADLRGDPETDAFAVSGGLGGAIDLPGYEGRVQDELFIASGGRFHNGTPGSGLSKGTCRGRQVAAVDLDANGLLDLFESCEGGPPKIYLKKVPGEFESVGPPRSLASTYRWVNLGGRKPELLAAERGGIEVIRRAHHRWKFLQRIRGNARNGEIAHFAVNDFDSDGDLDVLAAARSGNTLLRNVRGRLREVPVSRLGLPRKSLAASFVDYNNDGDVDLHLIPQGLYRATNGGRFRRTGELAVGKRAGAAITSWFDYDNDGLRDPIIALGNAEFTRRMTVIRQHNLGPGGHWLEVDLSGRPGNRQAIGTRVSLRAGGKEQHQWVGQNDDSKHSQGHYRLYFGLGPAERVDALTVHWSDGTKTKLRGFAADRLLRLVKP